MEGYIVLKKIKKLIKNVLFVGALVIGTAFATKQFYDINKVNVSKPAKTSTAAINDLGSKINNMNLK